jgi:NodT family efflux transporter outer membrane factor (OMF) lipoprotein
MEVASMREHLFRGARGMSEGYRRSRRPLAVAPVLATLLAAGCTMVGPDYEVPETRVPDHWQQALARGLQTGDAPLRTWWKTLDDPQLDSLIERATAGNLDLKIAIARVGEARAQLGIARGEYFPQVNANGEAQAARSSKNIVENLPDDQSRTTVFRSGGIDATWEVDVWGRIARGVESANAISDASVENYRDVRVLLYAEVAFAYIEVRALQERIRAARENVRTQQGALELTRARRDAQLVPDLDVRQAELNLARTQSIIPALEAQRIRAVNRLGVLLGQPPSTLHAELEAQKPVPQPPEDFVIGFPNDMLRQRPDIRRAERDLAAQTARIGVATGDLYPRFSLSGFFAFEAQSGDLGDIAKWRSHAWGVGPSVRWNIFDGARVRSAIAVEDARTDSALLEYENTILNALEDVDSSMSAYVQERDRRDALRRSVVAARESVSLVLELYRNGLTDFQNVLDMQRSLAEQEDQFAQSDGFVSQNLVRIYRALGGGWQPEPEPEEEKTVEAETPGGPPERRRILALDEGLAGTT